MNLSTLFIGIGIGVAIFAVMIFVAHLIDVAMWNRKIRKQIDEYNTTVDRR